MIWIEVKKGVGLGFRNGPLGFLGFRKGWVKGSG